MTYQQATDYLFNALPVFQSQGPGAYKPGLDTVTALSDAFGSPHRHLRCIHVGGTNGKGSTAHTVAAVLQSAGMHVGLFTSPHLVDFRERIRIDGRMISEAEVVDFVERFLGRPDLVALQPSFFELTTVMAFEHYVRHGVDVAVIEVGLGGRLDSTNIITPDLCIITNISLDHTALLGHTPAEIAAEKAGIIKPGIPVVISEPTPDTLPVFRQKARQQNAPLILPSDDLQVAGGLCQPTNTDEVRTIHHPRYGAVTLQLRGACQPLNARGILTALEQLELQGYPVTPEAVRNGFANVMQLTGLMGRWMTYATDPLTVCDTGHNPGGWKHLTRQLTDIARNSRLHMVLGFVGDKDISGILRQILTIPATYYWTQPGVPRALPATELAAIANNIRQTTDTAYPTVAAAYAAAKNAAVPGDTIFVGGSTFIVADLLK